MNIHQASGDSHESKWHRMDIYNPNLFTLVTLHYNDTMRTNGSGVDSNLNYKCKYTNTQTRCTYIKLAIHMDQSDTDDDDTFFF